MTDILEVNGKVGMLECRNMALLRNKIQNLIVPLSAIVDYYGIKF